VKNDTYRDNDCDHDCNYDHSDVLYDKIKAAEQLGSDVIQLSTVALVVVTTAVSVMSAAMLAAGVYRAMSNKKE
jgi:hypothetical protein